MTDEKYYTFSPLLVRMHLNDNKRILLACKAISNIKQCKKKTI
jgi:hypothetical protein